MYGWRRRQGGHGRQKKRKLGPGEGATDPNWWKGDQAKNNLKTALARLSMVYDPKFSRQRGSRQRGQHFAQYYLLGRGKQR